MEFLQDKELNQLNSDSVRGDFICSDCSPKMQCEYRNSLKDNTWSEDNFDDIIMCYGQQTA